jgi:M6 family metalloprotease-like protein
MTKGINYPSLLFRIFIVVFLVMTILSITSKEVNAVPADPNARIEVVQPDGSTLIIKPYGDERNGRLITEDGYTVTLAEDGYYHYAVLNSAGDLISSDRKVSPVNLRNSDDKSFLLGIEPYLISKNHRYPADLGMPNKDMKPPQVDKGSRVTYNVLVILIDFPDYPSTYPQTDFNNLMNQSGFDGIGSVNDYYMENSYGQFGITATTTVWYTAANLRATYGWVSKSTPNWAAQAGLAREAVNAAVGAGVNFAPFDNDGNGFVDGLFIVHAGPGAEAMGTGWPWSHKWNLLSGTGSTISASGKIINDYSMQPEKYNLTARSAVGVYCHEYGHTLGLPDLYDTDGSSIGIGKWGLMGSGSWNGPGGGPGKSPAHLLCWSKIQLGWITPTVVTTDLLSQTINDVENNAECYRLWTSGASGNEYFLVSYRKQVLFDTYLPGCGIEVLHIDDAQPDNTNDSRRLVDVEEADNTENNSSGDMWLGATFNDFTTPNANSYAGSNTNVEVDVLSTSCTKADRATSAHLKVGAPASVEIYIKDCLNDVGTEPDPTSDCPNVWGSPHIWIDNDADGYQDAPAPGLRNRMFFRAYNIGGVNVPSGDATLNAYFVDPAMGIRFPGVATPIADMFTGATTLNYPAIPVGGNDSVFINWQIPAPPAPINHYCIGGVLNATGDPQVSDDPRTDNNVAQINMTVFYWRVGQTVPPKGRLNELELDRDPTIFHTTINGCNTVGGAEFFIADLDWQHLDIPEGWEPYIENPGPHLLFPDSCVEIDVYIYVADPVHNDSGVVPVEWFMELNPNDPLGGFIVYFGIDDVPAEPISDLEGTSLNCPPDYLDPCPFVRLDWSKPVTDTTGDIERIRWFYVYRDTIPNVDTSDVYDSLAVDDDPRPGYQYFDHQALHEGLPVYYRIAAVDGAYVRSDLSNEVQVVLATEEGSCGDANSDAVVNVSDAVWIINYVFVGGAPPNPLHIGDANCDGAVNVSDAVWIINYVFVGGNAPCDTNGDSIPDC